MHLLRPHVLIFTLLMCVITGLQAPLCRAEDKNGVSPNTISLPTGPGSIEGLGEAFQPMLNTGSARYSVAIALPPGTGGHSPRLSLSYESGLGDGPAGIGWAFGPRGVKRQTDLGIPRYVDGPNGVDDDHDGETDEADETDRFIGVENEELVQLAGGTFHARIEGTFVRYRRIADHWEAQLKDGTRLEFGLTAQARVSDASGAKIFEWLLERSTDTNGNVIEFSYTALPDSDNRKYLQQIRYGPGAGPWDTYYFAYFSYEQRPDWRADYRSGFRIKTAHRLRRIDIGIQGAQPEQCAPGDWNGDAAADALIRRYTLAYNVSDTHYSFLSSITRYASDGVSYLPPVSFSYSVFSPELSVSAADTVLTSPQAPVAVMDSALVELIDLNRDGLPDLLQTDTAQGRHRSYLNLGVTTAGGVRAIRWDEGHNVASADGLALALHLTDDGVHLADMDGDGISDLVHTTFSREVFYYLNEGTRAWSARKRMSIQDTAPPAPYTRDDVETADLDFDKRMDTVLSTESGYSIWFNLKEGVYSAEVRTAGALYDGKVIEFSESAVHLADMNGDRLSDVTRIRPSSVIVAASMGHGKFASAIEITIPDTVLDDNPNGQVERARLEDINGDGLADLVVERAEGTDLWYWLNRGNDTFSARHVITGMPTLYGQNTVIRWADMNGNGTKDLVYADSTAASRLRVIDIGELAGGSAHPNLLTGIDNGLGVHTQISYKSSTQYEQEARQSDLPWSSTVPFPVSVVAQVRTSTGLDVDGVPGTDEYVKTFTYRDGFYEDRRKAFRGFAEVTVTESGDATAPTSVTTHGFFTGGPDGIDNDGDLVIDEVSEDRYYYREEDALKGMVRSVAVRAEDGHLFSQENNDWQVRNLTVSVDDIEQRFAYNAKTDNLIYEGTETPVTIRTTFAYDDYGNVTEARKYGALSITGDETFSFSEYINDTDSWMLGFVKRQYVTDAVGQKAGESLSFYDGADYTGLASGQLTKGQLTRRQDWVEGDAYINAVRSAYDAYGNIIGIKDGRGNLRGVAWDTTVHSWPVRETIEVGGGKPDLAISVDFNLGLGVITRSIDFNGNQTAYTYDRFARLTRIIKPGDTPAFPTQTFTYTMADPAKGLVYAYDEAGSLTLQTGVTAPSAVGTAAREVSGEAATFDAVQYVDGLGRKLALVEEGESGFIVRNAVLFNARSTAQFDFFPYATASVEYAAPTAELPALETRYDAAGRGVLTVNPPDKDGVVTQAGAQFLPQVKTVTDENGNARTFHNDGLGRLREVHERNGGETYVTRYTYDASDNLMQITDALNNVKTFEYDGLRRRTAINDPDRGRMALTYDEASNLVRSVDNKGQEVTFAYDGANRVLSEDYLDGAGIAPDVSFFYDEPSADYPDALNLKGRLARVLDLSGGTFFAYDARGNPKRTVKRITHNATETDYHSAFTYDAMDRVVSMLYPDGESVAYTYNSRSLLEAVPGYVEHIDYDASGRTASVIYANGVSSSYAYDPRQRLTALNTVSALQGNALIQALGYVMDGVSNITAITDGRPNPPASPKNAAQSFQYDDLYRLTRAQGPGYGAIDFHYDALGNMTFKSSPVAPDPQYIADPLINLGAMAYGGAAGTAGRGLKLPGSEAGPHALTGTESGLVYAYDDNGNMTSHGNGDVYSWDFKDRLVRAQTAAADSRYIYDFSGQRVVREVNAAGTVKTAFYISKAFEIREDKAVKHVFADSRRVARVETAASSVRPPVQTLQFQPGWNFFSLTVEPDDPAIEVVLAAITGSYTSVWAHDSVTGQYLGYVPADALGDLSQLHAQRGYIIHITAPVSLTVTGAPVADSINLTAGWNLVPLPADVDAPVTEALASIAGTYRSVWGYDTSAGHWQDYLPQQPDFLSNLDTVQPARAYWVEMQVPAVLSRQQVRTTHFYHPDHLGSSNLVTDASGAVVEATEFYPFGRPRYEERNDFDSAYKYTGKELDKESGLMYFEARYLDAVTGRFVSVDPLGTIPGQLPLETSHSLNLYAYALNNPLAYTDPTGLAGEDSDDAYSYFDEDPTADMASSSTSSPEQVEEFDDAYFKERFRVPREQRQKAEAKLQIVQTSLKVAAGFTPAGLITQGADSVGTYNAARDEGHGRTRAALEGLATLTPAASIQAGRDEYQEQREKGRSRTVAAAKAVIVGAVEIASPARDIYKNTKLINNPEAGSGPVIPKPSFTDRVKNKVGELRREVGL